MATALYIATSAGDVQRAAGLSDLRVLPLSPAARLETQRLGMNAIYPSWGRSFSKQLELQTTMTDLTHRLCDSLALGRHEIDDYGLTILASNAVLWRELIRFALAEGSTGPVVMPQLMESPRPVSGFATLEQERDWMITALRNRVVSEETSVVRVAELDRGPNSSAPWSPWSASQVLRRSTRGALDSGARGIVNGQRGLSALLGRSTIRGLKSVLVLAQPNKVTELLAQRVPDVQWDFISYGDLYAMCEPPESSGAERLGCDGLSSDQLLSRYAQSSAERMQGARAGLGPLAQGSSSALMTDGQHDPFVRTLVAEFTAAGKRVALVPEGCVAYTGPLAAFGSAGSMAAVGVTRFVIDEHQRAHWAARPDAQESILVSGYLGNTALPSTPLRRLRRRLLARQIRRPERGSRACVVTLTFDAFLNDIELGRFGDSAQSERLGDLLGIVEALDAAGIIVIAKLRDVRLTRELRTYFRGRQSVFVTFTDWQTCVSLSDALVTRDSSVGWEAAHSGVPIVVWNYSDFPSFVEESLDEGHQACARIARSESELVQAIQSLPQRVNRASHPSGPVPSLTSSARLDQVRHWVSTACRATSSAGGGSQRT